MEEQNPEQILILPVIKMSREKVEKFLEENGYLDRLNIHSKTIDTVEHAAKQIGCREAEIAKTLSFMTNEGTVLVVMAGDTRVNSSKFKAIFHTKPHMVNRDEVESLVGHKPGGVCPFAIDNDIAIWLDESLKRFEYIYPAGGDEFSSVKIKPDELYNLVKARGWCDIVKNIEN